MEIGKTFCGRTDGRTDGRTHLSSNLLGHRRGDDLKMDSKPVFSHVTDQKRDRLGLLCCIMKSNHYFLPVCVHVTVYKMQQHELLIWTLCFGIEMLKSFFCEIQLSKTKTRFFRLSFLMHYNTKLYLNAVSVKGWAKLCIPDTEMLNDNSFPCFSGGGVTKTCQDSRDGPGTVFSETVPALCSHDQPESY